MTRALCTLLLAMAWCVPAFGQRILDDGVRELAEQVSGGVSKQKKTRIAMVPFRARNRE